MKSWKQNWDAIAPIFKFSAGVHKVIYTTNAIESLNATYRKLNRQRSVFPSDTALLKVLHLSTFEATEKIVSRFFRKFNFCRLEAGIQPAMLSGSVSSAML